MLRIVYRLFLKLGIDFKIGLSFWWFLPKYIMELLHFIYLRRTSLSKMSVKLNPQLRDRLSSAGDTQNHYFWQDLLVAREIIQSGCKAHTDIGSRIDGFIAHLVTGDIKISILDIRPLNISIPNVEFKQLDLMKPVPNTLVGCCDSLSCLHTLEHFGLGRYGDAIDPDGYINGISQLAQLLEKNGLLYLSVPVGKECVQFNAHRVFDGNVLLSQLETFFVLQKFILIDDDYNIAHFDDLAEIDFSSLKYSCGIYVLQKI